MVINKIGKKTKEWFKARKKLIADLISTGQYQVIDNKVFGICADCGEYKHLTPDHRIKRSQGGKHTKNNIDWICLRDHALRDHLNETRNKKPKSNKAEWQRAHKCKRCKETTSMLICEFCNKISL